MYLNQNNQERDGNASQRSCSAGPLEYESSGEYWAVYATAIRGSASPLDIIMSKTIIHKL